MHPGVGKTLREARKRRDLGLDQVEASTKIRVRFLRAIEDEDWEVLPGDVYARSFVRTYGDYLGLDGTRLATAGRDEEGPGDEDRQPHVEPAPIAATPRQRRRRPAPRLVATLVALGLLVALIAIGLTGGGDDAPGPAPSPGRAGLSQASVVPPAQPQATPADLSLHLVAGAEVWVCLLDAGGQPLVDGEILAEGSEAGPFRSGSFTVSFGNGEVSMTVNGQQESIPATPSPIGYAIGAGGALHELPEGERPTCT